MQITQQKLQTISKGFKTDLFIVPVTKGVPARLPLPPTHKLIQALKHHLHTGDLPTKSGSSILFYPSLTGLSHPRRVLLLELGDITGPRSLKQVLGSLAQHAVKFPTVHIVVPRGIEHSFVQQVILQLAEACFEFNEHKSEVNDSSKLEQVTLLSDKQLKPIITHAQSLADGIVLTKKLGLMPANSLTPARFAETAKSVAQTHKLKCTVLGEADMRRLGMDGILGISRGSNEEAKFIILEYNPRGKKTVCLAGKGITFDSGGISIKPSKDLHEMKFDMIGGASVLSILQVVSKLKLPLRVVGAIAATENLPGGKALKPGDIITTYSGKTVEILNTDAEGRMVLCDALTYLQKHYKPDLLIDIATLTGAVIISLGNKITGAFGNNSRFNSQFETAGRRTGEPVHFLPLFAEYQDELKSRVADLSNIGKQKMEAMIGALFLSNFVEQNTPWIHLDIAGTAWHKDEPTGAIIHTVVDFLEHLK